MAVVPTSKFRHVFGHETHGSKTWTGVRASKKSVEGSIIAVNHKYIAVLWHSAGGGAFCVLKTDDPTKINPALPPLVRGHKRAIVELAFSPFHPNMIASGGEDTMINLWCLPDDMPAGGYKEVVTTLKGHKHKVSLIEWHPTSSDVMASASGDKTVHLWDVKAGLTKCKLTGLKGNPLSLAWNSAGKLLAVSSKDKQLRIWDPRADQVTGQVEAHTGVKGAYATFLGDTGRLATVGHSRSSERELVMWDMRSLDAPLLRLSLDTASSSLKPFYDVDTSVLYLSGRGDSSIKYFELLDQDPWVFPLSAYKSTAAQVGLAMVPKYACDIMSCHIAMFYKLASNGAISVVSMVVPRKSEVFQEDIFPDTAGWVPAQDADAWFGGADASVAKLNLEDGVDMSSFGGATFEPDKPLDVQLAEAKARIAELGAEVAEAKARIAELEAKAA